MKMLIGLSEERDILSKKKNHLKKLHLFSSLFFFFFFLSPLWEVKEKLKKARLNSKKMSTRTEGTSTDEGN